MSQDNQQNDESLRGPMKGVPDDQTPAVTTAGSYTGTSPDAKNKSQESENSDEETIQEQGS
ncbi:MAG TPA: hypothetical protein V6D10_19345 [Trichocoleus sp.]|jgi:phage terminase small subunit